MVRGFSNGSGILEMFLQSYKYLYLRPWRMQFEFTFEKRFGNMCIETKYS